MPLLDFTIEFEAGESPQRDVRIVVYRTVRAMRAAAARYSNRHLSRTRRLRGQFGDTLGVCHRFEHRTVVDGVETPLPLCAIVRLCDEHLGVGVVSHELAHAAVHIHELDTGEPLGTENDEDMAWALGELVRQTALKLLDAGLWGA